jgi:hypothetical protein
MSGSELSVGDRVKLVKGTKARGLDKGITVRIEAVEQLGADYSHAVKVVIKPLNGFKAGSLLAFFVRHRNRLSDPVVRMNDGNPSHTIEVVRSQRPQEKPTTERHITADEILRGAGVKR